MEYYSRFQASMAIRGCAEALHDKLIDVERRHIRNMDPRGQELLGQLPAIEKYLNNGAFSYKELCELDNDGLQYILNMCIEIAKNYYLSSPLKNEGKVKIASYRDAVYFDMENKTIYCDTDRDLLDAACVSFAREEKRGVFTRCVVFDREGNQTVFYSAADLSDYEREISARRWIQYHVIDHPPFPIPVCKEMYSKALRGDDSPYIRNERSLIARKMAMDKNYAYDRIKKQLQKGIMSGPQDPKEKLGDTTWEDLDLKLSLGSVNFKWHLEAYHMQPRIAEVIVKVTDTFDFNEGRGERFFLEEYLTGIGRTANLTPYEVDITYRLNVHVRMEKYEKKG